MFCSRSVMPPKRKASDGVSRATKAAKGGKKGHDQERPGQRSDQPVQGDTQPPQDATALILAKLDAVSADVQGIRADLSTTQQHLAELQTEVQDQANTMADAAAGALAADGPREDELGQELARDITGDISQSPPTIIPVDLHVSDRTRAKIWANEAIDMGSLLHGNKEPTDVKILYSDGQSNVTMVNQKQSNMSEDEWREAFNIFRAVFVKKFKDNAGLCIHEKKVVQLMRKKGDWRHYDLTYRQMIQKGLIQWGQMPEGHYSECLLRNVQVGNTKNFPKQNPSKPSSTMGPFIPVGFCRRFHKGLNCERGTNCKYKHLCPQCGKGVHPQKECKNKQSNKTKSQSENGQGKQPEPPFRN